MTTDAIATAIIDEFAKRIEADDRIIAAYVANDPPSWTGDRCFDVKLVIACQRHSYDELVASMDSLIASIEEVVWFSRPAIPVLPMPLELVTARGMQLELYLYKAELGTWRRPVSRILKQATGFFQPPVSEPAAQSSPINLSTGNRSATDSADRFWRYLPEVTRMLRLDQLLFAHLATLRMLSLLISLLGERRKLPSNRTSRAYQLDPADEAALMKAFREAPQSREVIARQHLALAEVMSTRGRAECEALGAAYPDRLERAIRVRVSRELAELRISLA